MTGRAATPGVIREFVGLPSRTAGRAAAGGHPCQGLYHHSVGRKPKVALIAAHYQIDFSEHYLAEYMAIRGIGFLGWNTRFRGFESSFLLDHALVDIGVGVRWLREVQGVETVVLLGNSGGGSLMAAYQSQAVDPNVTPLGRVPASQPGHHHLRGHVGGPAQHHRRAVAGPTPRPVSTRASSYSLRSSRLRTLPVGLRGSSSRKITSRGTL